MICSLESAAWSIHYGKSERERKRVRDRREIWKRWAARANKNEEEVKLRDVDSKRGRERERERGGGEERERAERKVEIDRD